MYLKVRALNGKPGESDVVLNISKRALIEQLRQLVYDEIGVQIDKQKLFYKGKQLIDGHRIMDYDIQLNDVIQLLISNVDVSKDSNNETCNESTCGSGSADSNGEENGDEQVNNENQSDEVIADEIKEKGTSKYYKIGDQVDAVESQHGAWFEASIIDILKNKDVVSADDCKEPEVSFILKMDDPTEKSHKVANFNEIRPRSRHLVKFNDLYEDATVLVNYNIADPATRGYWYDFVIKKVTLRYIMGTILVGEHRERIDNCKVKYVDEVMKIEKAVLVSERSDNFNDSLPPIRKTLYYCERCKDVHVKPCRACGCKVCAGKDDADNIILCDECDDGFHLKCLDPPLTAVPSEPEWYCPQCKVDTNEIVKAGDKLKFSKKKANMASAKQGTSSRDWGHGMACVGRTTVCTIVPKDHFGPIPGIDVGTCWKFRLQVSEVGIHRPHVAGIHGRETDGAYSLVLSGGYEDDVDNGDEFVYSGSGGRDLSGNKRISEQSSDQTLTRMNKALALNCNVPLSKEGGTAQDWRRGKPVRVVRNYKIQKHSAYGPKDGNRYDGIYKVVKYYPETGKSGFLVWKYVLRRDDPTPAPWAIGGKELEMLYPAGFLEARAAAKGKKSEVQEGNGVKRKASNAATLDNIKKVKIDAYKLSDDLEQTIKMDVNNEKLWNSCMLLLKEGKQAFLNKVEELFMCICCQEVVHLPITTECKHNFCKSCLKRSFAAEICTCPSCRFPLGKDFKINVNEDLSKILLNLFPGYESHR